MWKAPAGIHPATGAFGRYQLYSLTVNVRSLLKSNWFSESCFGSGQHRGVDTEEQERREVDETGVWETPTNSSTCHNKKKSFTGTTFSVCVWVIKSKAGTPAGTYDQNIWATTKKEKKVSEWVWVCVLNAVNNLDDECDILLPQAWGSSLASDL